MHTPRIRIATANTATEIRTPDVVLILLSFFGLSSVVGRVLGFVDADEISVGSMLGEGESLRMVWVAIYVLTMDMDWNRAVGRGRNTLV